MEKDILVILMIAFGLFAVIMFVLFYAYLKKYYNSKHIELDYERDIENNKDDDDGEDIIGKPDDVSKDIDEDIKDNDNKIKDTYHKDTSLENSSNFAEEMIPIRKK